MFPDYPELVKIATRGHVVSPRGKKTFEVPYVLPITFNAGETVTRLNMNYQLAWLESLMYIAGVFDLDLIAKVAPRARLDLYAKQSDYGPRMLAQLVKASDLLLKDPDTRRAVVLIDRPEDTGTDNETCATSIQFLRRTDLLSKQEVLQTIVTMRSWDMCLGLPYDIITFGAVAQVMAAITGCTYAAVTAVPGSLHIYEENLDQVKSVMKGITFYMRGFRQYVGRSWLDAATLAKTQLKLAPWPNGRPLCVGVVNE